ncbi:SdpI family protein [Polaribacter staleyi]|uniref:SdpI family protein n=1 Tax=Polaribacter staleyi TaxID=2022337 RepID=UPI0031B9FF2C
MSPIIYILTTNGLLFILSIIFWKFPPKKINNWYGYRTPKATLNQQIWDFANSIFNKNLVIYAGISFLGGLVFANFATKELTWQPMVLVLLSVLVSVIKTERALNDHFTEEGKKKKLK